MKRGVRRCGGLASLAIVVVSALFPTDEARACSCVEPGLQGDIPQGGDVDVVRNVRLFSPDSGTAIPSPVFVDDGGASIPAVVTRIEAGEASTLMYSPVSVLEPGRAYMLRSADVEEDRSQFTTGIEIDEDPPPIPEVRLAATWATNYVTSSCGAGAYHGVSFEVTSIGEAPIVLVHRGRTPSAFDGTGDGEVTRVFSRDSIIELGSGGCTSGWPDADGGASESFSFAFIDRAGNFSGWSDAIDVTLPMTVPVFGCTHTSASARAPWSALALVLLLVVARRRRAHPSVSRPLR